MMSFLKSLFGSSGRNPAVDQFRRVTGQSAPPGDVGAFKAVKEAYLHPDAGDYGHKWSESALRSFATRIAGFKGFGTTKEMLPAMGSIARGFGAHDGLTIEDLARSMGEDGVAQPTETADFAIQVLRLGDQGPAGPDPLIVDRLAHAVVADPALPERLLAWLAMAIARSSKAGKIRPLEGYGWWTAL